MKNVQVKVLDKNTLELMEDAQRGDRVDLNQVIDVDTTIIEARIKDAQDKIYKQKLEEQRKLFEVEKDSIVKELTQKLEQLKSDNLKDLSLKEQELKSSYDKEILNLKNEVKTLTDNKTKELEIAKLNIESSYKDKITNLENEKKNLQESNSKELESLKKELESQNEINILKLKETHSKELLDKDNEISLLKQQKSSLNVKTIGEDLESYCNNTVTEFMQNGLSNCTWTKDNNVVKEEDETKGSKADFIFKVYADETHDPNEELTSVCLDMKDENPSSVNKQTNDHYFKALDKNRTKKNCQYAVLVSALEIDKPGALPIYKVKEYDNMYVVRPGYLMTFLNLVVSLTNKYSTLLLSDKKDKLELKSKLDLIDEFNKIKQSYLDKPLENLEKQLDDIDKSSDTIIKSAEKIKEVKNKIVSVYISEIERKIDKFELNLDKKVIKNLE